MKLLPAFLSAFLAGTPGPALVTTDAAVLVQEPAGVVAVGEGFAEALALASPRARWVHERRPDVDVRGFEPRLSAAAAAAVETYLDAVDHVAARRYERVLWARSSLNGLRDLREHLDASRARYVAALGSHHHALARQHARTLEQASLIDRASRDDAAALRDRFREENLRWIVDHEPPGERLAIWYEG